MGYANERMPWHPRKVANAASMEWRNAGYGSLAILALLLLISVVLELRRSLGRWLARAKNTIEVA